MRPLAVCLFGCLIALGSLAGDGVAGNLAEIETDWFASLVPGAGLPMSPDGFTDGQEPTFAYTAGWGRKLGPRWNWTIINFAWRQFGHDNSFFREELEAHGEDRDTPADGGSITIFSLTSELNLNIAPRSRVNPFLGVGAGLYPFSQETMTFAPGDTIKGVTDVPRTLGKPTVNFNSRTPFGVNFGGGIELYLSEGAAFVLEGRYHVLFMDVDDDRQLLPPVDESGQPLGPGFDQSVRRPDTIFDMETPKFVTVSAGVRLYF